VDFYEAIGDIININKIYC